MKLIINESPSNKELEIVINCNKIDENLLRIISLIKSKDKKITANKDNNLFVLDIDNIL